MVKKISILASIFIILFFCSCEKQEKQMEDRDKFVGRWDVVENVANKSLNEINMAYIANIARSETFPDETYIYNFFNVSDEYYIPAYVKEKNIIIEKITLRDYTVRGSGTLSENENVIDWIYWVEGPYDDHEIKYIATYTLHK